MGKIKQLPPHEIHKIAAGEVIEKPANVIKELVENSLDAGAHSIVIYVEQGGKSLMRVIDDGVGMSYEDAHMSIMHHATSKLRTINDLESITTFGFRGEALSSIAAISRMTLVTRQHEVTEGIKLSISEGIVIEEELVASNPGTDITISDLFLTVPARRKFLKSDDTEWRAIYQLVQAFALSYPECAFTLYHNNKRLVQCRVSDHVIDRIKELYDQQLADSLLACESAHQAGFTISGQISDPHIMRYDRASIFIFVNRRWIKNPKLVHSLIKGYSGVLQPARYPQAAIFITIEPHQVDINIHPRKEEVHFLHPRRVEHALETMVKTRLEEYTAYLTMSLSHQRSPIYEMSASMPAGMPRGIVHNSTLYEPSVNTIEAQSKSPKDEFSQILDQMFPALYDVQSHSQTQIETNNPWTAEKIYEYRLIGQLLETYLLIENQEGLVLIDQHAAHERILYELFANRFEEVAVVPLLFPPIVTLHEHEAQLIEERSSLFAKHGITINRISAQQCAIQSVPVMLKNGPFDDIVRHVIMVLQEELNPALLESKLHHSLRAQMACKSAVKAGDLLTMEHMHELIASLNKVENRFSCPHGRPTLWPITRNEIERKFKRKM